MGSHCCQGRDKATGELRARAPSSPPPRSSTQSGASVAERAKLWGRSDTQNIGSPKSRTESECQSPKNGGSPKSRPAALRRLRTQTTFVACDFCGLELYASEAEKDGAKTYHKECFRCAVCSRSLRGVPHQAIDDCLYCDESGHGRSCYRRLQHGSLAVDAIQASTDQRIRNSEINVCSKAQQEAIDLIGDDLEDIISNMAPKCAICGGTFGATDNLVMQGMVKIHKDCLINKQMGKAPTREQPLTPAKACASTPNTLLLKLILKNGKKVMTFFMTKSSDENKKATTVEWLPDAKSRAPNSRACAVEDLNETSGASLRAVGELGADIARPVQPELDAFCGVLVARFVWKSNGLNWDLCCTFEHVSDKRLLTSTSAKLTVIVAA